MCNKNHSDGANALLPYLSSLQTFYTKAWVSFFLSKQAKKTTYFVQKKEGEIEYTISRIYPFLGQKETHSRALKPILLQIWVRRLCNSASFSLHLLSPRDVTNYQDP